MPFLWAFGKESVTDPLLLSPIYLVMENTPLHLIQIVDVKFWPHGMQYSDQPSLLKEMALSYLQEQIARHTVMLHYILEIIECVVFVKSRYTNMLRVSQMGEKENGWCKMSEQIEMCLPKSISLNLFWTDGQEFWTLDIDWTWSPICYVWHLTYYQWQNENGFGFYARKWMEVIVWFPMIYLKKVLDGIEAYTPNESWRMWDWFYYYSAYRLRACDPYH